MSRRNYQEVSVITKLSSLGIRVSLRSTHRIPRPPQESSCIALKMNSTIPIVISDGNRGIGILWAIP